MVIPAFLWAMPLLALLCTRHYGTGLYAACSIASGFIPDYGATEQGGEQPGAGDCSLMCVWLNIVEMYLLDNQ